MSTAVASRQPSCGQRLLMDVRQSHRELLAELDIMDSVTGEQLPDFGRYTTARWRLTKASRTRRKAIERVSGELGDRVGDGDAAVLRNLRVDNAAAVRRSSEHIHHWTSETIKADWAGYCRASNILRKAMRACVKQEQEALYTLLARY